MTADRMAYRPDFEDRWHKNRTAPVRIEVRTEWLYSKAEKADRPGDACKCCPGRHAFSRGADVVRSDVPSPYESMQSLVSHVHRAIELFGDDADLVIEVRRAAADLPERPPRPAPLPNPVRPGSRKTPPAGEGRPVQGCAVCATYRPEGRACLDHR